MPRKDGTATEKTKSVVRAASEAAALQEEALGEGGYTKSTERNEEKKDDSFTILGLPPKAIVALNSVAIIWGTQHAVIKIVADDSPAGPFTLLRFGIGALISTIPLLFSNNSSRKQTGGFKGLLPYSEEQKKDIDLRESTKVLWRWGAEMGGWLFLGFAFHTLGVATTTAQRSGFLLYLNIKFVPFFAFLLLRRQISISTWVSAFTAFAGTALLAYDGTSWNINRGDLWCIAAAAASAMYILRLDSASEAVGDDDSAKLNAACLWVVTILSAIWSIATVTNNTLLQEMLDIAATHPLELIYLSAVTTALANFIQTKAQKEVSAERASVIYAMDPVYGAFFSNLLLGESLTGLGYIGAGMITIAAATNVFFDLGTGKSRATRKGQ